ncbi:epidermal growth factor receptor kinase substrate 8-like protein 2 isoform X2 [Tribolium madens]|uniref:epidermal growth factor receptor kinase substrate 8-like protein 2 isoform X2 n=1 Tax=Tribolium madens TaxID=41895 RepID=UPI001CF7268A|nr:epidermal growth factor receptor kinase substrate 8-like protein 2 isoform X2 [Tribolium madens]
MAYRSNGYSGDEMERYRDEGGDKPTYLMEHLATFTVTKETGIMYPADGMRRLLQLEKTNGIWSQKMQLCLDRSWVLIMDYETGSVMERFPANSIQEPTAFTSHDPMEMYNNILVFNVANSNPAHPPEMHIFQCQSISALDLVEDLKQLRMGKTLTRSRKSSIPPPTHKPPPHNVINPNRDPRGDYHGSDSELTANNDDSSSTTSEKYERDVTILNHCFDDIEKFIARLQHAAAAARELERRRRSRKSKKRDMGDGMLTMRTKPPPEKEFIDIFQKFKLSFNLLAKLKAHIHDPNAPELVHFLFTPLALIVEASHDTYPDSQLPRKVVSPLLTREAVNLLMNCVTSKETELWHSLGNAWLIPRDQWKGHVAPYHPIFMDGWSPDYPVVDELEANNDKHYNEGQYSSDYSHHPKIDSDHLPPNLGESTRSDISVDSIERNGGEERGFGRSQESFLEDLQARGANIVQVTYPRTANNDKELTVVRGEYLEILDDSRKWWKARNSRGQIAHVPHTIVTPFHSGGNDIFNNPLYTTRNNYNRNRADSPSDRFSGGHSPNTPDHVNPPVPATSADWVRKERLDTSSAPPPPAPPPPPPPVVSAPVTPAATLRRTPSTKSGATQDKMQDELNIVLSMVRDRKHKPHIEIRQTPEVFINQKSNPEEVQNWLKIKDFDSQICAKFKGLAGHNLFDLQKSQLEKVCGPKEGARLYSQLNIQKSVSGYQTVRSSELKAILAKAREKIETVD